MLTVPLRTLTGLSGEPAQLTRIGAVTPAVARDLVGAATTDPTCEQPQPGRLIWRTPAGLTYSAPPEPQPR
jgi:hypothetical protein